MIKYVIKGSLANRKIEKEYFENQLNPIEAREDAFRYFTNFVEILKEANVNFEEEKRFLKKSSNESKMFSVENEDLHKKWINAYFVGIGIYAEIIDNDNGEKEEHKLDFYGVRYDFDEIAYGLQCEFEFYKGKQIDVENIKMELEYCDTEFYEEDGVFKYPILKNTQDWKGKNIPYWWLNSEQRKELVKEIKEDLRISYSLKNGESNLVEYKPSLVYNFKTRKAGIGVKQIIAKSICAFLNSNGGTLLIGVNDQKEIIGLESDFSISEKEDFEDWFKLQFDDMIFQFFDQSVWNFIKADFNRDYDTLFFMVKISPSDNPVFLKNVTQNTKDFYIRNTASTKQLTDIEEIVRYSLIHFNSNAYD